MIHAFVLIEAEPDAISELAASIVELDGVREAHSVAGSECDLVAVVAVSDHEAIARVVTDGISKLAGVTGTRTMIAFRSYSAADLDAGYEGFGD